MAKRATIYFDRDCGLCTRSVGWVRRLDWLGLLRFAPLQGDEARMLGIEEHWTLAQIVVRQECQHKGGSHEREKQWGGWRATKQVLFRLPALYLATAAIAFRQPLAAAAILLALSPIGNPLGNALYRWAARNRHRLPGSTCVVETR